MLDGLLLAFDFSFTSDSKFYSFKCDSKFYDYLPISYCLQVTICTVTRQVFLKMCVKTQCLLQSTLENKLPLRSLLFS